MTGTMWHSLFESMFNRLRLPVMTEVRLDSWLPEGWSGTADWVFWNDEYKAFVLGDLKTIKGEGVAYIVKDGIKKEHLWQLSAYWYALERMGLPLVKGFVVLYLPQNVPIGTQVEPTVQEGMPLDRELVLGTMADRWQKTKGYLGAVEKTDEFVNNLLAPPQDRVQILRWNKPQGVFDVKLAPHWSAAYCPYPTELCDCRDQSTTKIGHYDLASVYHPRKDYEDITPDAAPTAAQLRKQREEQDK